MRGLLAVVVAVVLTVPLASAADLESKLDRMVNGSVALSHGFVGMQVVRLRDGRELYARNSEKLFVPASNMKLFTTALALSRLGPDYRLTTQVGAEIPIGAAGTLAGDLELVGGGDPSLSGRDYPYRSHAAPAAFYSFRAIEELADQLAGSGLKRVEGSIIGDDRRYVWDPQPGPWSSDSATQDYGAPVSALIINDNTFSLTLEPAERVGDLARLILAPPFENLAIDNRVVTTRGGARKIELYRSPSGRELHVWGVMPKSDPGYTEALAIGDPALYAAEVLRDALVRRGIQVDGAAVARHRFTDEIEPAPSKLNFVLASHRSPPLLELLQVADKVSQNLHTEVFLREVAVAAGHQGSLAAGLAAMDEFLASIGVSSDEYQFTDGSGLSHNTLVAPLAITKLLVHMDQSPYREQWVNLLPIGGEDGTLQTRFAGHPEARAIHAKTGTLDHVRALSGYADTALYGRVAFSLLVNNVEEFGTGATETSGVTQRMSATRVIDELLLALIH